jgi:hypothetical protein
VNVELKVREPTSLIMLKLVTRLRTPSATRELIECISKVLDGTSKHVHQGLIEDLM